MKSSFLLTLVLGVSFSSVTWAQASKKKPSQATRRKTTITEPKKVEATETASKTEVVTPANKSNFDKFYERLKVSYFSAFQSSSLGQWDSSQAIDEKGVLITDPMYTFNQISFNYNFGWKMNFVVNPRWTNWFGSTRFKNKESEGTQGEQTGFFTIEDTLVGFQGVILSNADKKFNLWTRAGVRVPTSRSSRNADITMQPEIFSVATYDFNKTWQLGSYVQLRQWVYQQKYTAYRFRTYFAPYVQYAFNDKTRLQFFYEIYLENRKRLESENGLKPRFKDYWQNLMLGVNTDLTPKVNFFPFIGYFLDNDKSIKAYERPLDAAWVGFWLSWQIK